jgi:tape measure domain-containing protein
MGFTVDIKGNASHLDKTIKNVKTSLSAIGSVATTAATSLAGIGVAGGAAMAAFIITSSKAAADVEDLGIQFEVLTGSAKTAAELMKTFRDEEKKSALSLSDYANAAKTMLAFGTSLDDVTPSLRMLGDVSMANSERFGSLALAFAQTTAAGRLMGQEVLQFVNAGFNPLEQISRDTGRSMQDLKKDMEDGAITVDMVKQAFVSATSEGGRFYKAIDKGSASTNAKLNQLSAAATQLRVAFGTGFNEGLKDALDATNTFLPQLEKQFTIAGTLIGDAISEGVNGNTDKLADVGVLIGDIIIVGMKAAFITGMNSLGGVLGEGIAQF